MARAHCRFVCQALDRQGFAQVRAHPVEQLGEAAVLPIHLDKCGKLGLPAWPTMIDDQFLCRAPRDLFTKIFADQGERQIDPCRDARGRPDLAFCVKIRSGSTDTPEMTVQGRRNGSNASSPGARSATRLLPARMRLCRRWPRDARDALLS